MTKLLKSNSGLTLVEVVIVTGLLAVSSYISIGMIETIQNTLADVDNDGSILEVVQEIKLSVSSESTCGNTLRDSTKADKMPKLVFADPPTLNLDEMKLIKSAIIHENQNISPKVRIAVNGISATVQNMRSFNQNGDFVYPVELTVDFEKRNSLGVWKRVKKNFNTFIIADKTTRKVKTCYQPKVLFETAVARRTGFAIETMGCNITDGNSAVWRNKNVYIGVGYKLDNFGQKICNLEGKCATNCASNSLPGRVEPLPLSYYDKVTSAWVGNQYPYDNPLATAIDNDFEDDGVCFQPGKWEHYFLDGDEVPAGEYWGNRVVNNNPFMKTTTWANYFPTRKAWLPGVPAATVANEGRCWINVVKRPVGMTASQDNDIFVVPNVPVYFGNIRFLDLGCNAKKGWALLSCAHSTSGTGDHDTWVGVDADGNQYCRSDDILQPHGDIPFENGLQSITAVCGRVSE